MINTTNGYKKIEEIKENDIVRSLNEETNTVEAMKVVRTFINKTAEFLILIIGNEKIYVTKSHILYTTRGLIKAGELLLSDKLYDINNKEIDIDSIEVERQNEIVKTYNFEVEKNHNYYVSKLNILVHNESESI